MKTKTKSSTTFSSEEKAAMRERAREAKAAAAGAEAEADCVAKIREMPPADRALAERIHALVKSTVPELAARTWYGMPAYAKDGRNICFFKAADKFKSRYATLGFTDSANLDDGNMWPAEFAVKSLTAVEERRIADLLRQAVS